MFTFDISGKENLKINDRYWQFCVGSGHAALAHRADYRAQLERAHKELGFKRVRFHGIFCDDMYVYPVLRESVPLPGAKDIKEINFYQVAEVYDALLKIGIKPFVELTFMPNALASGKRTFFHYKGNVTPPKDYGKWAEFIEEFVRFLINRYGAEEVEQWYFEVWNEPNLRFAFFTGTQKDYFKLYRATAEAIKRVDKNIMVGGPATSSNHWVTDTIEFCKKNDVPLDFLSTHWYPGEDIGLPLITWKNLKKLLTFGKRHKGESVHEAANAVLFNRSILPMIKKDSVHKAIKELSAQAGDIPLFYTEWNVNANCTSPQHDTKQSACYIVKTVLDWQYHMQGSSFWTFSDIFEEFFFFPQPFSGSFGFINIHGIPKPSFWAFKFLAECGDERLDLPTTHEEVEISAFKDKNSYQFLLYRQKYHDDAPEAVTAEISIGLDGIGTDKIKAVTVKKIDSEHCNPKGVWEAIGAPDIPTPEQVEYIKNKSVPVTEAQEYIIEDGKLKIRSALYENDVHMITVDY